MFDVGFTEVLLLLLLGLLVLGPERLPRVARTLGAYSRRARAVWHNLQSELDRELDARELKRQVTEPIEELQQDVRQLQDELNQPVEPDGPDPEPGPDGDRRDQT